MEHRARFAHLLKSSYHLVLGFAIASLALGALYTIQAWTGPTATAPGGNTAAPLNVSATGQTKSGGLLLNTGGATNGLIVQSGNVGIGTTNPLSILTLSSSAAPYLVINSTNSSYGRAGIAFDKNGSQQLEMGADLFQDNTRTFYIFDNIAGATRFFISDGGNVGIGTTNTSQKLTVNGYAKVSGIMFPDGTLQTTAYTPAPIAYLYGNVHTTTDCNGIGSVTGIGGNNYCRVSGSSCPGGWTSIGYNSTSPATCSGDGREASTCTTSWHTWTTSGKETCTYSTTYPTASSRTCTNSYSEVGCY